LFQNTGDPTIVLVVQINNMIAPFTILERMWYKKCDVWNDDD